MQFLQKFKKAFFVAVVALFTYSPFGYGFDVVITESEFRLLHDNCKKFYSVTGLGRNLGFTLKLNEAESRAAHADAEAAGGAWHYCAGLVYMNRALTERSEKRKQEIYKKALAEISFSAQRVRDTHRIYGEIQLNKARVLYLLGEKNSSMIMLQELYRKIPTYVPAKIELSNQYAKGKKLQEAIDVLLTIEPELRTKSADVNYALGLYLYKQGKLDESYIYARQAYALRYPLPWLRRELTKKGYKF